MTMRSEGRRKRSIGGRLASVLIIAAGLTTAYALFRYDRSHPSTDAAVIDAEVVHVAPSVGGRIAELLVEENGKVAKGDVLFRIDPAGYELTVAQSEADLGAAIAARDSHRRSIATETSNAEIAKSQTARAETNLALARRTVERLRPLAAKSYVPTQEFDQAKVAERDAALGLAQARKQEAAALEAIGSLDGAEATIRAREAALAQAKRALSDTVVVAPHEGRIVGLSVLSGEYVAPGQSLFTLISTERWFAVGNFRETELSRLPPGTCVTAYSMIDRARPIRGEVESLGFGVKPGDRADLPRTLPLVERSMNWVRVAQRFPVRVLLEHPPEELMRVGASASIEVGYGASCR
ncbi:multidrug efflux system membrane fusion protein [Methylopila capsulata]|uniref:Multidrug efflux system membrane fusion protein n=1 Tax=Methylopila capsulata TaxID=61654 RepID=A0A9W6IPW1_9HYPH|nr:multidrug transporter subunit MdtN [Methylopila capsulata]MBM7851275.1 multidrug efflux system membrane fusion protein [Methylopila capsulata]GLK54333.1 multidrug resistance protein MdtN [Methylopila capsulata]